MKNMKKTHKISIVGLILIIFISIFNSSKATEENEINKYNGTESVWADCINYHNRIIRMDIHN